MSIYDSLNPMQKEAVFCTEGPLLILAGAGSGKTRVLTHRAAYLIEEKQVNPWNIMAITFTNKAAEEMRQRVDNLVSFGAESIWVSTFHSSCVRILRRYIDYLGYSTDFTIYDSDDQKTLMRQVFKAMNVDPRQYKERAVLNAISAAKDRLITPEEFLLNAGDDFRKKKTGEIYQEYQRQLKKNNALDFDDLIMKTVELFQNSAQVLAHYQERFRYIMVDEYQDTNYAQFKLVELLAGKYKNLCVVGDDDQSIYKFRGADIENILSFEKAFPGARVIKLEQNYRSTQNILDAANQVIRHNHGRKEKSLWTDNGQGAKVIFRQFENAAEEADYVARQLRDCGYALKDQAVLYRTNAQSRLLEERCIYYNVPYRLVGGVNFYQRKEIKDMLAYLRVIANGADDLSVLRIINVPKRGIGTVSMTRMTAFASEHDMSLYDALKEAHQVPGLGKTAGKIKAFVEQIGQFRRMIREEHMGIPALIQTVLEQTGYQKELEEEGEEEAQTRLENIEELVNKAAVYEQDSKEPALSEFLEQVALVADIDSLDPEQERATLMTLHSAKGLEFAKVYITGMEDGLFPSYMSITSDDPSEVEEERRLCYVGITRAKKELVLTAARMRMVHGETRYCRPSRFIDELPKDVVEEDRLESYLSRDRLSSREEDPSLPWNQSPTREKHKNTSRGFGSSYNPYASLDASPREPGKKAGAGFGKTFTVQKSQALDYGPGDRVKHVRFGQGTVKEVKDGGRDFEVTVDFDTAGTRKMFASFAKLEKM